jgi:hypothetical protein
MEAAAVRTNLRLLSFDIANFLPKSSCLGFKVGPLSRSDLQLLIDSTAGASRPQSFSTVR